MELTSARRIYQALGLVLGAACIGYFARELWRRAPEIAALPWNDGVIKALAIAVSIQFASAMLDAWTWGWLLRALDVRIPPSQALSIFGLSQFAKYLPGNVAQHVGRVSAARARGYQTGRVILSLLLENGVALLSGALVAGAGAIALLDGAVASAHRWETGALVIALTVFAGTVAVRALLANPPKFVRRTLALDGPLILPAPFMVGYLASQVTSYLATASGLAFLLAGLSGTVHFAFTQVLAAAAVSWLAGYLTPGAPGGIGIREATLTTLLGPSLGTPVVLSAALLWRLTAFAVDVLMLVVGTLLRKPVSPSPVRAGVDQ